jgi:hypothetical protein
MEWAVISETLLDEHETDAVSIGTPGAFVPAVWSS